MKKINISFIIKLILCIAVLFTVTSNISRAEINSVDDLINQGTGFMEEGKKAVQEKGVNIEETVFNNLKIVGQVLVAVGTATVLIVTLIMAIKWITATPDKQAQLKSQLIGLVVAIVVIFGAVGIWNLTRTVLESIVN